MSVLDTMKQFFGGRQETPVYTPPPREYPTQEEAEQAKKYDFSYGQPYAARTKDDTYRVLVGDPNESPLRTVEAKRSAIDKLNKLPIGMKQALDNYYTRAALAVQRSALATLGFDPEKVALDIVHDPKQMNILGTYGTKADEIYTNVGTPWNIVHESLHRGIDKLRGTKFWKPEFEEIYNAKNEATVRRIMQMTMGNPEIAESEDPEAAGRIQQSSAEYEFTKGLAAPRLERLLADMESAAAQYLAAKHPGGPR